MNYRVESLTFFRFIAAVIVVIFHLGGKDAGCGGILVSGPQMVTFFFVLSGFVMMLSYFNKNNISTAAYWWSRLSRIMPVYLLAIALMVTSFKLTNNELNVTSLVLNLLLLQSWFSPHPLSINAPGWSLSVEVFFYFTFPMILGLIRKYNFSSMQVASAALLLWAATQIVLSNLLSNGFYKGYTSASHDLIYYFPLSHFCSFLLGIAGGMWFIRNDYRVRSHFLSLIIFGLGTLLIVTTLNNQAQLARHLGFQPAFGASFFAPLFLIYILSISLCQTRIMNFLSLKPLVILGEASYSLYILQMPVYKIYTHFFAGMGSTAQLDFFAYLVFLTAISIMSFLLFERPANKLLRLSLPKLVAWQMPK